MFRKYLSLSGCYRSILMTALVVSLGLGALAQSEVLRMSISTPDEVVKSASAVRVKVTLTNTSPEYLIQVHRSKGQSSVEENYVIDVRDSSGNPVKDTEARKKWRDGERWGSNIAVLLRPGQSMQDEVVVSLFCDMTRPDEYTVRLRRKRDGSATTVESNALKIKVSD